MSHCNPTNVNDLFNKPNPPKNVEPKLDPPQDPNYVSDLQNKNYQGSLAEQGIGDTGNILQWISRLTGLTVDFMLKVLTKPEQAYIIGLAVNHGAPLTEDVTQRNFVKQSILSYINSKSQQRGMVQDFKDQVTEADVKNLLAQLHNELRAAKSGIAEFRDKYQRDVLGNESFNKFTSGALGSAASFDKALALARGNKRLFGRDGGAGAFGPFPAADAAQYFNNLDAGFAALDDGVDQLLALVVDTAQRYDTDPNGNIANFYNDYKQIQKEYITPVRTFVNNANQFLQAANAPGGFDTQNQNSLNSLVALVDNIESAAVKGLGLNSSKPITSFVKSMVNRWKKLNELDKELDSVLQIVEQLVACVVTLVIATCNLLPAINLLIKQIAELLQSLIDLGFLLPTFALALKFGFLLKPPTFLSIERLKNWPGLAASIADTFMKRCVEPFKAGVPDPGAIAGGIAALATLPALAMSGADGIGKSANALTSVADPTRAAWILDGSVATIAPNPIHITPELASTLGPSIGSTIQSAMQIVQFATGLFMGLTSIAGFFVQRFAPNDETTPVQPTPAQQLEMSMETAKELVSIMKYGGQAATSITKGTDGLRIAAKPEPTEDEAKDAYIALLASTQEQVAGQNLVVDENSNVNSLTNAARDYFLCKQQTEGTKVPYTSEQQALDSLNSINNGASGLPNSPIAIVQRNRPATPSTAAPTIEQYVNDPLGFAYPSGFRTTDMVVLINSLVDPLVQYTTSNTPTEDLPFMLLCTNAQDFQKFLLLDNLNKTITDILLDPTKKAAHDSLRSKAQAQGLGGGSPYTYLGIGFRFMPRNTASFKGLVEDLLKHEDIETYATLDMVGGLDAKFVDFMAWLKEINNINMSAPLPTGLTANELAAADESRKYVLEHRGEDIADFIFNLRIRSDQVSGPLGYEYTLMNAVMMLTNTAKASVKIEPGGDAVVRKLGKDIQKMSSKIRHSGAFKDVLATMQDV